MCTPMVVYINTGTDGSTHTHNNVNVVTSQESMRLHVHLMFADTCRKERSNRKQQASQPVSYVSLEFTALCCMFAQSRGETTNRTPQVAGCGTVQFKGRRRTGRPAGSLP